MKILITGNMGYVGPSVVKQLRSSFPNAILVGLDLGFFAHCLTGAMILPEHCINQQLYVDVRNITEEILVGVDAVIHLAGISNDPMGQTFELVTDEINCQASIRLASLSKKMGVKHYVFASSCSIYGFTEGPPRKEEDELNPLTAYARSKIRTENGIAELADDNFIVTALRFATACGMSDRLRLDLVLNDFVASAVTKNKIEILSDGTPWRPLIHIKDMARAIEWAVERQISNGGRFLPINVGSDDWNYQVQDLAEAVSKVIPDVQISVNKSAAPDKRSYQVNFEKFRRLAPNHQPQINLFEAILGLKDGLELMKFKNGDFRQSDLMRLKVLTGFLERNQINEKLEWTNKDI